MSNPNNTTLQEVLTAGATTNVAVTSWSRANCSILLGNNGGNLQAADTNSDGTTDYLRLVGCGSSPNRKVEIYDNMEVEQNVVLRSGYLQIQAPSPEIRCGLGKIKFSPTATVASSGEFLYTYNGLYTSKLVAENTLTAYGSIFQERTFSDAPVLGGSYNVDSVSFSAKNLSSGPLSAVFQINFTHYFSSINVVITPYWTGFIQNPTTFALQRTASTFTSGGVYNVLVDDNNNITGIQVSIGYYSGSSFNVYGESVPESSDLIFGFLVNGILV